MIPPEASGLFGPAIEDAARYVSILGTRGVEWGLIGPREADRLWERHVVNSLAVSPFIADGSAVVDVGSGAGLPGIPVALARPDLAITLLEPLERRARFLTLTVEELGLTERVRVIRDRAETHGGFYDVVTCRAVAPLTKLLAWTAPLFLPGGRLVALKGASAVSEVEGASKELRKLHVTARVEAVRVHPDADETWVTVVS